MITKQLKHITMLILSGWLLLMALALSMELAPNVRAATPRYVAPNGANSGDCSNSQSPCATIAYALDQAVDGDTISIATGTYTENLTIDKDVMLQGTGPNKPMITGNFSGTVIIIDSDQMVTIADLIVANGNSAGPGGGIWNEGSLTINHSTLVDNRARGQAGGGAQIDPPYTPGSGGAFNGFGGAIFNRGTLEISNSTFADNIAQGGAGGSNSSFGSGGGGGGGGLGGAIFNDGGAIKITQTTFANNQANGGIGNVGGPGLGGSGSGGGGDGGDGGMGNLTGNPATDGTNGSFGGGGGSGGSLGGRGGDGGFGGGGGGTASHLANTLIPGGAGGFGGGQGGFHQGNQVNVGGGGGGGGGGLGGAIFNISGTVSITNSTFSGNQVRGGNGGGTPADGNASGGDGGDSYGGAIFNYNATTTIAHSTFYNNQALNSLGGSIYSGDAGAFPGSDGQGFGGGIASSGTGLVTLQHTLIAGSSSGGDCSGTFTSLGYNLVSDSSCNFTASGDLTDTDPLLNPLQLNPPGDTKTHALQPGSLAIDAISAGLCPATDQRGIPRPQGESCDIGAFEVEQPGLSLFPNNLDFGEQEPNVATLAQTVTLTSTGAVPLTISDFELSSGDYGLNHDCPSLLAGGSSCHIGVVFTPTVAGFITGTLTITHDAFNSPHTVNLSGTGIATTSLTIRKEAEPKGSQVFSFTSTITGFDNFTLVDDGNSFSNTLTFSPLLSGSYTITETVPYSWALLSIHCSTGISVTESTQITVDLLAGEQVSCIFTNEKPGLELEEDQPIYLPLISK